MREVEGGALELIDGHLRAETTPEQEVPVLVQDVDEAEAAKLLATLDPLAALAGADADKLKELLGGIATDSPALAELFAGLARDAGIAMQQTIIEDVAPEPLPKAVTRPGDLWLLCGKRRKGIKSPTHRLLCGDSTKAEDVATLMDGALAALCATDPPYLVDYTGERPKVGDRDSGKDWSATTARWISRTPRLSSSACSPTCSPRWPPRGPSTAGMPTGGAARSSASGKPSASSTISRSSG